MLRLLCYPKFNFLRRNSLNVDIYPVYGYILPASGIVQVPGVSLIATGFYLHDGIDALGRHTGVDDMVFTTPQVKILADR